MKNFDLKLYEEMCSTLFNDTSKWEKMYSRCDEEYKKCASHFSKSFREWYEHGYFHDAVLKSVSPIFQSDGKLVIHVFLEPQLVNAPQKTVLKYTGVTSFSIKKTEDATVCYEWSEDCLYGEFYRSEENKKKVVHEFFTTNDTFFYIEFEKLTCE